MPDYAGSMVEPVNLKALLSRHVNKLHASSFSITHWSFFGRCAKAQNVNEPAESSFVLRLFESTLIYNLLPPLTQSLDSILGKRKMCRLGIACFAITSPSFLPSHHYLTWFASLHFKKCSPFWYTVKSNCSDIGTVRWINLRDVNDFANIWVPNSSCNYFSFSGINECRIFAVQCRLFQFPQRFDQVVF